MHWLMSPQRSVCSVAAQTNDTKRIERWLQKSRIYAAFEFKAAGHNRPMPPRKTFGRNVARLRLEAGLTQEQLCEAAEIDRSYLQRIESGGSSPTVEVAVRLRRAMQCSWDELMEGME